MLNQFLTKMLGYCKDALIVNCKADNYVNPNPIANEDISMFYDLLATNKLNIETPSISR